MRKIIAGNFKSNLTKNKIVQYYKKLNTNLTSQDQVYIFPPFFALESPFQNFIIGAQNAYPARNGAFSGEITQEALEDLSINHLLIGHSERRNLLKEDQEFCAKKFDFYKNAGFTIFYCIGESLEIRQKGQKAIEDFLKTQFEGIDTKYQKLIVAYEPIWAIGTGMSAEKHRIKEVHQFIKSICPQPLLYGGSVQLQNLTQILETPNVDGVLVGGASLDVDIFSKMIELARSYQGV